MNEPPVRFMRMIGPQSLFGLDRFMEHLEEPVDGMTYVLSYVVDGLWIQEVYQNVEWVIVRMCVKSAVSVSGECFLVMVNGWCINLMQDVRSDDDGDGDDQVDAPV